MPLDHPNMARCYCSTKFENEKNPRKGSPSIINDIKRSQKGNAERRELSGDRSIRWQTQFYTVQHSLDVKGFFFVLKAT